MSVGPLDHSRWMALWHRLGAQGSGRSVFAELATAYAEPVRAYHNADHIRDCLLQFDLSRELAERPDEVEAALWFHDAVYAPGAADNEDRSARLAQIALVGSAVPLALARRVAELVLETRHLTVPKGRDAQLVCDIDLSILGRPSLIFDDYQRAIRLEYAEVPESEYRPERAALLAGFLRRPAVYQTEFFRERYEEAARQNLRRALSELR